MQAKVSLIPNTGTLQQTALKVLLDRIAIFP